ncbi:MAG: carbamoyltransferase HypF [Silicimonas sp.]
MRANPPEPAISPTAAARDIVVAGRVQGVGFRPFVYRIARRLALAGSVTNRSGQVLIHVEGGARAIEDFETALLAEAPALARPELASSRAATSQGARDFTILASVASDVADVHLPPDLFCCADCLAEMRTPSQRRYRYPFINCTQCGPRYTIISALPYDRPDTSMAGFAMCPRCRAEYDDPRDRRFHAQPLACPDCGPTVVFSRDSHEICRGEPALRAVVECLRNGEILAVKGIGGYHLICDPASDAAVQRLRRRKNRPHKPLAVMFPQQGHDGLDAVRQDAVLGAAEAAACLNAARPIVLARRRAGSRLGPALAPGLSELGVFLPYSPLHHLLLADFGGPLVATSGNISGEPVLTGNEAAERQLAGIADAFLHHDRPIVRAADDSVLRIVCGAPQVIRSGRGLAPSEIALPVELAEPVLAVGGHMKGAVALAWDRRAVLSPHIGDLDSPRSRAAFSQMIGDLQAIHRVRARRILCDLHPGYASSRWAYSSGLTVTVIPHHVAHASALAGEHPEMARWLTFAWDGVGLGGDGCLWGGEVFEGRPGSWRRVASLRPFHLLGGDRAAREPWRSAAALMWEAGRPWEPPIPEAAFAAQAWGKRVGTLATSSAGRLFDAAAALILGLQTVSFEGQGPMMLESVAMSGCHAVELPIARDASGVLRADWAPLLPVLADESLSRAARSGIFHESLAQMAAAQVAALRRSAAFDAVGLTGGVFQNRFLSERIAALLTAKGIPVLVHRTVPANDGGLAFGQLVEYAHANRTAPGRSGGRSGAQIA